MQRQPLDGSETVVEPDVRQARGSVHQGSYLVGQRVFGRHGATQEYFAGYVVAVDEAALFPYLVDVGGSRRIHVLGRELQSDLPAPGATPDDILEWLCGDGTD